MKRAAWLLVVAALAAAAFVYYRRNETEGVSVQTAAVTRGDIVDTVGATGTLQAVTTVQIGSQVSGTIQYLGADFNSIVKKGQIVAKLDPSLLQAQVEQARANLTRAQADLERNRVALADAQQKNARAQELGARSLLPQSEIDAAKVAVDTAVASLKSAEASVTQAQASLSQAEVNLQHTVIASPIDGIVTQRNVDIGQTVAASLQSPTLFVIAADLTQMQVNASIDEADVGRIRPQQHVTFRVDAYPADQFEGTVSQIRLQPVVVQNVTTYGAVIDVSNPQLKLKPGMTATVKIEVARRDDAVRVPNTALRFRPTEEMFAALGQPMPAESRNAAAPAASPGPAAAPPSGAAGTSGESGSGAPRRAWGGGRRQQNSTPPATAPAQTASAGQTGAPQQAQTIDALFAPVPVAETPGRVWVYASGQVMPVRVRLGLTDGVNTELLTPDVLPEGAQIVTNVVLGEARTSGAASQPAGSGNPLLPQRGGPPAGFGGRGGR